MTISNKLFTIALSVILISVPIRLHAQQNEISVRTFPSSWYNSYFEPGFDGAGIAYAYHPLLNKVTRLNISGEFDVLRSRNEFLLGFGINKTFIQAEHFRISLEANILNGIDLYKPSPLYVGGLEGGIRMDYYLKKRLSIFLSIDGRLTFCPGYRNIGVWKHSSWPVTLGLRF
jgi:hypothetical protein